MTYEETLAYLYEQLPMFSKQGSSAYKKDLHNTIALCEFLDNPNKKIKTIHIAGTNGKGSTSHMLAAVLQECGYKTGLYTSPHVKHFGERIRINGQYISEDFVIEFTKRTKEIIATVNPSFFELTVAMAFEYFAENKTDIAIIETGLGGRLDSTNIITPCLSIITNIGYDHMNILGNTLQEIASEKAGIIKNSVPVVIGEYLPETKPIFIEKASQCKAAIVFAEDEYTITQKQFSLKELSCKIEANQSKQATTYHPSLKGVYQLNNIKTTHAAIKVLETIGFNLPVKKVQSAIANSQKINVIKGRWQKINDTPLVIADVAHNAAGISKVIEHLELCNINFEQVIFVVGMVSDKDVVKALQVFPKQSTFIFTQANIPRAMPANELQQIALVCGIKGQISENVNEALAYAKLHSQN
jgi:dihydrofolate synthase / folylpolyglutamate synthase